MLDTSQNLPSLHLEHFVGLAKQDENFRQLVLRPLGSVMRPTTPALN